MAADDGLCVVTTLPFIRTQLWLTNYPQIGGSGPHIAHLLRGGLFIVVAVFVQLSFPGRSARRPAASDNNYFFRPLAALLRALARRARDAFLAVVILRSFRWGLTVFFVSRFGAVFGLGPDILLLVAVRTSVTRRSRARGPRRPRPPCP